MKRIILFAIALAAGYRSYAQTLTPVTLTGFTADVVADGSGTVAANTSTDLDGASFNFVANGYVNPSNQSPTSSLPANGTINSATTTGVTFQLAPYTGNNSLRIATPGTGTLTFSTPRSADQIYVLATSGSGLSNVTMTVNFTDNTSQAFTQTVGDWYGGANYAIRGISRVSRVTNTIENSSVDPRLYQFLLTISTPNTAKLVQSITFNKTSTTGVLNVMGVTARFITPPMANDLGISAISGLTSGCALTNQETIRVTISNTGSAAQSNFPVSYKVNNGPFVTETFTGSVAAFGTAQHTFTTKANLSTTGTHTILAKTNLTTDGNASNDATTLSVINSLLPALPVTLDFESATTGLGVFQTTKGTKATIVEATGASSGATSTKGLIMDGINSTSWVIPAGTVDPWINNPTNQAAAKICINPAGGSATAPLWLSFDLKQLFKTANANTNFRVTVNGTQVGPTYRPPFNGAAIAWQRINVDLTSYKTQPSLEIAFESNVKEEYANGTGTANLIDNISVSRSAPTGIKAGVSENTVQVYPNPSTGIFQVSGATTFETLEVQDMTGKVLHKQNLGGSTSALDLKGYAKGIYLLKLSGENSFVTRRLVIE
jgi:hypothetical protein